MNKAVISEKLVKLRGNRTQKDAAKLIGISQSELSMFESGDRIPSDEKKVLIAKAYKKSVQYIFYS